MPAVGRSAHLEQITLAEQYGDCVALHEFPAAPVPSLDVAGVDVEDVDPEHVAFLVEFEFDLSTPDEEDILCDVTAAFRLVYRMRPLRTEAERREFGATRAVQDAWPYWRAYLASTMGLMGLQPLHLSPEPPAELAESARDAFDISLEMAQHAET